MRVRAFEEAALDQARHLHLAGARFEAGQRPRERPVGCEDRVERLSPGRAHRYPSSAGLPLLRLGTLVLVAVFGLALGWS